MVAKQLLKMAVSRIDVFSFHYNRNYSINTGLH
jgi:hypothetical protein